MKIVVFLTTIAALTCLTHGDKNCHGVYIDDRYYNLEIIKEGINNLHDLVINRNDNAVYFTYDDVNTTLSRRLAHFDLGTKKATVIDNIRNATAIAVDQFYGRVYVGGSDGLYKLNGFTAEKLPLVDDIKSLYYKELLYFVNTKQEAYKFEDGIATPVQELRGLKVDSLVIDADDNIIYNENSKIFRVKLGTRAINTHERHTANRIATDVYSRAILCTKDGLYIYNKYKFVFDKIANLSNLKAIAFNKMNEPVYAVNDLLIKLTVSSIGCFED